MHLPRIPVLIVCYLAQEEEAARRNATLNHTRLRAEVGATNELLCAPPVGVSPAMVLWWLYRQPVMFNYVVLTKHVMAMLIDELLPHELEARPALLRSWVVF